jgi:hypothetical protein
MGEIYYSHIFSRWKKWGMMALAVVHAYLKIETTDVNPGNLTPSSLDPSVANILYLFSSLLNWHTTFLPAKTIYLTFEHTDVLKRMLELEVGSRKVI